MRGVGAEADQQGQPEEARELPLLHAAVKAEVHPGQQGDDGHLGVVAGEGEGQEGRREHEGDAAPQAGPTGEREGAQEAVHPPAGEEDGEHVAPAEVALMGGEQLQQAGRKEVGADLLGCRVAPEGGLPGPGAVVRELLGEGLLAAVEIGAGIASVDDLAAEGEVVEIEEGQEREDGRNRPGGGEAEAEPVCFRGLDRDRPRFRRSGGPAFLLTHGTVPQWLVAALKIRVSGDFFMKVARPRRSSPLPGGGRAVPSRSGGSAPAPARRATSAAPVRRGAGAWPRPGLCRPRSAPAGR